MANENDTATVEREETTEESSSNTSEQSDDLRSLIEEQNKQIGILKRELKRSTKETKSETPKKTQEPNSELQTRLDNLALKTAGISHEDDVTLARETAKKWGLDIEALVEDEDFKSKLERQQDSRANAEATSNVKGNKTKGSPKSSPEYWIAKGTPPTREEVPDRKTRAQIAKAMMSAQKSGKKFYSD
jgi:hypothetical protein